MKRFASDRVAGLMERMGLEGEMALESRLVSQDDRERPDPRRGLQLRHPQARRRVRRRHQQAARDDLRRARQGAAQRGPDRDRARASSTTRSRRWSTRTSPGHAEEWDWDGLAQRARPDGPRRRRSRCRRPGRDRRPRGGHRAPARGGRRRRSRSARSSYGAEVWAQVERLVLLRTIDTLWVDHLTELDDMRRGIGLRGYGGIDPLERVQARGVQAVRGAARLHQQAGRQHDLPGPGHGRAAAADVPDAHPGAVRRDEHGRQRLTGRHDHACRRRPRPLRRHVPRGCRRPTRPAVGAKRRRRAAGSAAACCRRHARTQPARREAAARRRSRPATAPRPPGAPASAAKLGRNDPCWCGSGKKFKRCHGA